MSDNITVQLASEISKLFLMILMGYVARRTGYYVEQMKAVSLILVKFCAPVLFFYQSAVVNFSSFDVGALFAVPVSRYVLGLIMFGVACIVDRNRPWHYRIRRHAVLWLLVSNSRDVAITWPIIGVLYPASQFSDNFPAYVIAWATLSILFTYAFAFVELELGISSKRNEDEERKQLSIVNSGDGYGVDSINDHDNNGSKNNRYDAIKNASREIAKNPMLIAAVLGMVANLILNTFNIAMPQYITDLKTDITSGFSFFSLFVLGTSLVGHFKFESSKLRMYVLALVCAIVKLLISPVLLRFMVPLIANKDNVDDWDGLINTAFIFGSMPCGAMPLIMARKYGIEADTTIQSLVLILVLSPFMIVTEFTLLLNNSVVALQYVYLSLGFTFQVITLFVIVSFLLTIIVKLCQRNDSSSNLNSQQSANDIYNMNDFRLKGNSKIWFYFPLNMILVLLIIEFFMSIIRGVCHTDSVMHDSRAVATDIFWTCTTFLKTFVRIWVIIISLELSNDFEKFKKFKEKEKDKENDKNGKQNVHSKYLKSKILISLITSIIWTLFTIITTSMDIFSKGSLNDSLIIDSDSNGHTVRVTYCWMKTRFEGIIAASFNSIVVIILSVAAFRTAMRLQSKSNNAYDLQYTMIENKSPIAGTRKVDANTSQTLTTLNESLMAASAATPDTQETQEIQETANNSIAAADDDSKSSVPLDSSGDMDSNYNYNEHDNQGKLETPKNGNFGAALNLNDNNEAKPGFGLSLVPLSETDFFAPDDWDWQHLGRPESTRSIISQQEMKFEFGIDFYYRCLIILTYWIFLLTMEIFCQLWLVSNDGLQTDAGVQSFLEVYLFSMMIVWMSGAVFTWAFTAGTPFHETNIASYIIAKFTAPIRNCLNKVD